MGVEHAKMVRQLKALRNFKKYEDIFYAYLNKKAPNYDDLDFYLVPKDYIVSFCNSFNYRNNLEELKNLNIYHETQEKNIENKIIEKTLITNLREKNRNIIDTNLKLPKINNNSIISNHIGSDYTLKVGKDGLFIPLSYNIWDKFHRYYGCDITLKKKGFNNKGELFIMTEKKRIDTFFKDVKTGEVIYHFCFKMSEQNHLEQLKQYFKTHSAKELIERSKIKYVGNQYKDEKFKETKIKIPLFTKNNESIPASIYYLDSYIFKENRESETITFKVEKGLKQPDNYYETTDENEIFKKVLNIDGINKKILMHNFDTDENNFFNSGKKSLIQGLILAYKNHYPIVISPDMIWILFLQGFSRFMEKYSEFVRDKFVDFSGKKIIEVKRKGIFPEQASKEIWQEIIDDFIQSITSYIGGDIISTLQSEFTTTEEVTLATSQATIMSSMKNFFEFEIAMGGCGISAIILEGTVEDWEKIKSKLNNLLEKDIGLNWWIKHLVPIIDNIIMTKNYLKTHKEINKELNNFWKGIIRIKSEINDFYNPFIIDGWITKFIPNLSEDQPKLFTSMKNDDIPDQIISCPIRLTVFNLDKTKTIHQCDLTSGFFGMTQNKDNYSVRPVIGYALISNSREDYPATEQEIKEIYQSLFY